MGGGTFTSTVHFDYLIFCFFEIAIWKSPTLYSYMLMDFLNYTHRTTPCGPPIISNVATSFYKLAKYLARTIRNITGKNKYYIKNLWKFKQFIDGVELPNVHNLVSFDVVSMLTNIHIELVLKISTKNCLYSKNILWIFISAWADSLFSIP